MSSERVIERLVDDLAPVRPNSRRRDALLLAGLGAAELALFLVMGEARPDLQAAMALPSFWWKLGAMGLLTVIGVHTALRSYDPATASRATLRLFYGAAIVALLGGWAIDATGGDPAALGQRLMWHEGVNCVFAMTILSLPPIVAMGLLMRRGAPTDRPASALATGLASAAWGTFIFVFNCPHDDPLYIAVWYVAGCAMIALAVRLILPRIARW